MPLACLGRHEETDSDRPPLHARSLYDHDRWDQRNLVERSTSRADFDNVAKQVPGAQPISGLGDAAYGASAGTGGAGAATVLVLKGSKYISVVATSTSKTGTVLLDGSKTLART